MFDTHTHTIGFSTDGKMTMDELQKAATLVDMGIVITEHMFYDSLPVITGVLHKKYNIKMIYPISIVKEILESKENCQWIENEKSSYWLSYAPIYQGKYYLIFEEKNVQKRKGFYGKSD